MRFNDGKPIFAQIAELFADDIVAGRIPAGARLPSARDIAASFEVNPNTAVRALQSLSESGIAQSERGTGYYVSETGAQAARAFRRARFFDEDVPRFFRSMNDLDVSFGEIESRWKSFELAAAAGKDGIA